MRLFKRFDSEKIREELVQKEAAKRSFLFVIGCLISALSFNLFYVPYGFVGGGLGGLAIVINNYVPSLDTSTIILIGNALFVIISLFTLGLKDSLMSIIGATLYTIFVYFTQDIPELINFSFDNILLYVLAAGVVGGFGEGLVYMAGFNTGGNSILAKVIQHYKKMPLGQVLRDIAIVVILLGGVAFGYTSIMYSLIITVLSTSLVDKMLIGISDSKTFFINTAKEEEVKDFIIKIIESGVTEFDSHGVFSHKRNKMLMCVVPTEKYSLLKSAIKEIDKDAFIVVSDCYEVLGGTGRKKLINVDD